jgi:FMN-dependent NADH-azoreductase
MSELLYVEASPSAGLSHSSQVAGAYVEAYLRAEASHRVRHVDLWNTPLPAFDRTAIEAKFAVLRKNEFTPDQLAIWHALRAFADAFCAADEYLFSLPMWNFGVPYVLKHYIDIVTLADVNWSWSKADGYKGLLHGKRATLVYSSAGPYALGPAEAADDFQKPYMRRWLRFLGIEDIVEINAAPTLTDPQTLAGVKQDAIAEARRAAMARPG